MLKLASLMALDPDSAVMMGAGLALCTMLLSC